MAQLCGGRFRPSVDKTNVCLVELNRSLSTDWRLFADDIDASKAYAEALAKTGLITVECKTLSGGLELLRLDWIEGPIKFLSTDEDVHTVNERRLIEMVETVGQKLHTGRSRNDQVVTDFKLWLRKCIRSTLPGLRKVIEASVDLARHNNDALMPGYTHMQFAQPVRFSHWILSHTFALREDCLRFFEYRERSNVLPLGSGAIAGNPLGLDRQWLAKRLGFDDVTQNSMHAVGDRDFVVDFIYCTSLTSLHLSRLAEDLILYATKEFNFVRISDAFSTGSSLMPQKRNPDSLELVRGISSSICACLSGAMMMIKGTPSTYNKDLQFDKQYCFDAYDKLQHALVVTEGALRTLQVNVSRMQSALNSDMLATDWAYYLVRKGVPFRQAYHYIGVAITHAEELGITLADIPLDKLQEICSYFEEDIAKVVDYGVNVEYNDAIGGTASKSVKAQIQVLDELVMMIKGME